MGKKKYFKNGQCVYCGRILPITKDHVPPRSLFASTRRYNLIKVPSCKECHGENKQVSQDDEYFRLMLTLRHDVADHPDAKEILPTVMRSLEKPDKIGFRNSLLKNLQKRDLMSRGGLYLGKAATLNVDLNRIYRVLERVIKGLFYHEKGYRLPDNYMVNIYSDSEMETLTEDARNKLKVDIIQPLASKTPHTVGNDVFSYRVAFTDVDPNTSAWVLIFYQNVFFLCVTLPMNISPSSTT